MPRPLTPSTSVDNLKKEAKRWLKALRANDPDARARLNRAYPVAPADAGLRDVQHALAREYGYDNWIAVKTAIGQPRVISAPEASSVATLATRFLEYACPDHHVRGLPAHTMARHAAVRLLREHPNLARANFYTAIVCGEIDEVERQLRDHPELANMKAPASGPSRSGGGGNYDFLADLGAKDWHPLLFLCFTRLDLAKANDNAVAIARLLLDRGADPNVFFMAGDSRYTPLVGAIGEGEENRPAHPRRDALVSLLLERGAEPYDGQVIYNIHFHGKILWWTQLMYEFSAKAGRAADWNDPEWHMLDQGSYGTGARWHLRVAVQNNDLGLAEWCLAHGANPNTGPEQDQRLSQLSLYEQAVRGGQQEMADLLARYGAEPKDVELDDEERFALAALRLDRDELRRILVQRPELLESPKAMFAAAERDRADAVALLLELGTSIDVEDSRKQRPLHVAAANDARQVAALLIERGADVDPYELTYFNTPLAFAVYFELTEMIALITPHSRDVWNLTRIGAVDRLREILTADPNLATTSHQTTPLFWLPEDEEKALEIAKLLIAHGADPAFRSKKDGTTAAFNARRRGLTQVVALLDGVTGGDREDERRAHVLATYEQTARDLVTLYETDDQAALDRVITFADRFVTYEDIRTSLRQRLTMNGQEAPAHLDIDAARELVASFAGFAPRPSPLATLPTLERVAHDMVLAFDSRDEAALQRVNAYYGRTFTFDDLFAEIWRRTYSFRQRSSRLPNNFLLPAEAQVIVARDAGFESWAALTDALTTGSRRPVPPYEIDEAENVIGPRRRLNDAEWDELIAVMKERRIPRLHANGLITDAVMARVASLDHVTALNLGGSRELSDVGLLQLAQMPQLERLDLSEYPGGKLTDRGLEVLRHLPNLRVFEMTWQRGITDAGVANLTFCDRLEKVVLMGSPTGDGAINALRGKKHLREFKSGRLVTDKGLALLHDFPRFKQAAEEGADLLIDGPFSNKGLSSLAGLEGVAALDLFWHVSGITSDGYVHLANLPNLMSLGSDGKLTDDVAMRHIAAIPRLRHLRAQEAIATDDGFTELGRSKTLQGFWGRECPNFGSRGFKAFSKLPALRSLGIGCRNVDDDALSTLPDFPSLRELTPIGFTDAGFRHVGRCDRLERLTCMYCRETGDVATQHIANLRIKYYYAGLTQITDRSLEILGRMASLEQAEFYECKGITDAGLKFLANLPNLREVQIAELPGVTFEGTRVFPARVRVRYAT